MAPIPVRSLTVSKPDHVSQPPQNGPVRVLTLDGAPGGALRGLAQIKIVRALMRGIWKRDHSDHPDKLPTEEEIDAMRPCDHFNMIFGSGTGGAIAIYLGRLNLTIKECEEHYKAIGDEIYARPFSSWNPRNRYNYDHVRFEEVLKEQTRPFPRKPPNARTPPSEGLEFGHQSARSPECKAAVLTKMVYSIQAVHVTKSYEADSGEVWQAIRATTASYGDFPNVEVRRLRLLGPDSGFNNPAGKAWNEATALYPNGNKGIWFISIGSGVHSENKLHPPVAPPTEWEDKLLASMVKMRSGVTAMRDATAQNLPGALVLAMSAASHYTLTWTGYTWEFFCGKTPGRDMELHVLANKTDVTHATLNDRLRRHRREPEPQGFDYYRLNLKLQKEIFDIDAWGNHEELLNSTFSLKNTDLLEDSLLVKDIAAASRLLAVTGGTRPPIRILTLDGAPGGVSALVQLRVVRRLMKALYKHIRPYQGGPVGYSDADIDGMCPCEHFDLIVGSGTGGLIAIYLGVFKLTIKQCEDQIRAIGNKTYAQPFSRWNMLQRYNYDYIALEEALKAPLAYGSTEVPERKFCFQIAESPQCKVVVLASTDNYRTAKVFRSYRHEGTEDYPDSEVWQVMRATLASHRDFAPISIGETHLLGPEAAFCNPSSVALSEAEGLFRLGRHTSDNAQGTTGELNGQSRGICIISIGNGLYPENPRFLPDPIEHRIHLSLRKLRGILPSLWAVIRGKLPSKVHPLRDLAIGSEHEHRKIFAKFPKEADIGTRKDDLRHYFDSAQSKYFRFNIEDIDGLVLDSTMWNEAAKARVEEWASQEYSDDDIDGLKPNYLEAACLQL